MWFICRQLREGQQRIVLFFCERSINAKYYGHKKVFHYFILIYPQTYKIAKSSHIERYYQFKTVSSNKQLLAAYKTFFVYCI